MNRRVLVVGDVMLDVVVRPLSPVAPTSDTPSRVRVGRGGAAANLAVAMATAEPALDVVFVGARGDDAAGQMFQRDLEDSGVRVRLETHPGSTGVVVALVAADGERAMMTERGVNGLLSVEHVMGVLGDEVRHVHVSGYCVLDPATRAMATTLLESARRVGATTSVDVCSVAPLRVVGPEVFTDAARSATMLFANEEEATTLASTRDVHDALETLSGHWSEVVVTRGARGALVRRDGVTTEAAASLDDVVDSTGAGDCATGTYLALRLRGEQVVTSLEGAMSAASRVVGGLGSRGQSRL